MPVVADALLLRRVYGDSGLDDNFHLQPARRPSTGATPTRRT